MLKYYLAILKTGVYLTVPTVLLVYNNFLFPYITSKQIYFNILIEILLIFYITLIVQYPQYRPNKNNYITLGWIAFLGVAFLTCFTGVDFNLSFWGDIERMLGVFHVLHFLALYLIIIAVMRSWRDWQILFITSIFTAFLVSIYGLKANTFSTIGNTAYVSGYLIFNVYFALILALKEKQTLLKSVYLLSIIPMLFEIKKTASAGGNVGFGIGIFIFLLLYGFLSKNKKIKYATLSILMIGVLTVGLIFINKDKAIMQDNLGWLINDLSLSKNTFQTRLISWRAALADLPDHLWFGTGYGNFAISFDKYFEAKFYTYTASETYFDRAHNNVIDILSTTGIIGLIAYLSIFIAFFWYWIKSYFLKKINLIDFALITSLIIAYFIQNLAVFDSLPTYLVLMTTLGFAIWIADIENNQAKKEDQLNQTEALWLLGSLFSIFLIYLFFTIKPDNSETFWTIEKKLSLIYPIFIFFLLKLNLNKNLEEKIFSLKEKYCLFGSSFLLFLIIYYNNWEAVKMLRGTIDSQIAFAQGDILKAKDLEEKALKHNTGLDRDSRSSFMRSINSAYPYLTKLDKKDAESIIDYGIELGKKNLEYNQEDSLMQFQLADVAILGISLTSNKEKAEYYLETANTAIDASIKASPERIPVYFTKARIALTLGDVDGAVKILRYASSLNDQYPEGICNLGKVEYLTQRPDWPKTMFQCLNLGGADIFNSADFNQKIIADYENIFASSTAKELLSKEDQAKIILNLYEKLSASDPNNTKVLVILAQKYLANNQQEKAIETARRAGELDPSLKSGADEFIKSIMF